MSRDAFRERFMARLMARFYDPAFRAEDASLARLDRFIGYYEPDATSHEALDRDEDLQQEVANAAEAVATCVEQVRRGRKEPDDGLRTPRAK
jgi:hypothetical protein